MRERLVTLTCAIAAFALFYAMFVPKPRFDAEIESPPTSVEGSRNGYLGAWRWLQTESIRTESLRDRYSRLADTSGGRTATGNLLITTLPHRYRVRRNELDELRAWIEAGNTLFVLVALADTPDWTMRYASDDLVMQVAALTNVQFTVAPRPDRDFVDAFKRLTDAQRHRIAANRAHPLFEGVEEIVAESEFPADEWRAIPSYGDFVLSLAHDVDTGRDALWLGRAGEGRILISAFGSILANEQLSNGGNARFLGNLVAQSLGTGGTVIFDDQHQGLSTLYDANAFFSDPRLHATLWWLLGLWLVWVLGSVRLRGAARPADGLEETAFVAATGGFFARVLRPSQAGERLLELFFDDVRRRLRVSGDRERIWDRLERHATVGATELETLRRYEGRLRANRRVDLVDLQNLLRNIEAQL